MQRPDEDFFLGVTHAVILHVAAIGHFLFSETGIGSPRSNREAFAHCYLVESQGCESCKKRAPALQTLLSFVEVLLEIQVCFQATPLHHGTQQTVFTGSVPDECGAQPTTPFSRRKEPTVSTSRILRGAGWCFAGWRMAHQPETCGFADMAFPRVVRHQP